MARIPSFAAVDQPTELVVVHPSGRTRSIRPQLRPETLDTIELIAREYCLIALEKKHQKKRRKMFRDAERVYLFVSRYRRWQQLKQEAKLKDSN